MSRQKWLRWVLWTAGVTLICGGPIVTAAQPYLQRFQRGQNVVPVFEGWERNADGTFSMHFGYLNRNYEEEVYVPIGPDNHIEPGGDRGQPTRFVPRALPFAFSVTVPADWGTREALWTLKSHGRTETAHGSLLRTAEITQDTLRIGVADGNAPPAIRFEPPPTTIAAQPSTLRAHVTDDGVVDPRRAKKAAPPLQVIWIPYRGPGVATFTPKRSVAGGALVTTAASFAEPGEYTVRVLADDGQMTSKADLTLLVGRSGTQSP
jgi:hypothetical protein